ncbi:MAG: hypothetical protein BroJett011_09840 [Chloroflexota bacterium]|nr:MAG: hypothetical protein BroJett011_09840 [Chloroflexota bacterium]
MKKQLLIEQAALMLASLVWTIVILAAITFYWVYQDVQTRWDFILNAPPEALAQAAPPTATPSPTATLWPGPPPTLTPTPTKPPTPTATRVIPLPSILPETFGPGEPTPVVIAVEPGAEPAVLTQEAPPSPTSTLPPTPTSPPQNQEPTPALVQPTATQPVLPPPTTTQPAPPPPAELPLPPTQDTTPTRLVIESVGIDSNIIPVGWQVVEQNGRQYSIWEVADYAVGWHKTSAVLNQSGNTVMAGHNNINGEVFRDLVNVEIGDKVIAYAGDQKFEYEITFKTIVKEKGEPLEVRQRNAQWIAPTADERLTLVTCWPYTSNTHRVIVVAKPL